MTDVINAQEHEDISRACLREHVTIESRRTTGSDAILQQAISGYAFIYDRQIGVHGRQIPGQIIRPAVVNVRSRLKSVRDRIS
jgi:hypothetical protein